MMTIAGSKRTRSKGNDARAGIDNDTVTVPVNLDVEFHDTNGDRWL